MTNTFLENQNIKLEVEKKPGCKTVFTITTLPLATKAAESAAAKAVGKQVNIPGFRKGRAPEALIATQFEKQIKEEFKDILVRNSFSEAVQLSGIQPLSDKSQLRLLKCEAIDNGAYSIGFEFDSYPEIPAIDPTKLTITKHEPEAVTQEQIDSHIEELRLHHCKWEEITDRKAQEDDFATLNIDVIVDDQSQKAHENTRFRLREGKLPRWLLNLAIGLTVGESATGLSEPESQEDPTFTVRSFTVELTKLEKSILPELDDELAKKAGVDNVDALKAAIQRSIEKDAANKALQMTRFSAKKSLIQTYPIDLPGERLKELLKECTQAAEQEGADLSKEQREERMMHMFNQGKDQLAFSYLLYKLFRDNKLSYPQEAEIRQRATEEMVMRYMRGDRNITENDLAHFSNAAENEIVAERALDFLIDKRA